MDNSLNIYNSIFLSIKTEYVDKILKKIKKYEYRNYLPKQNFKYVILYEVKPVYKIRYVLEIDSVIKYPEKIKETSDGTVLFNEGKKSKYAYHIQNIYHLKEEFTLPMLKSLYNFKVPQSFSYCTNYENLIEKMVF